MLLRHIRSYWFLTLLLALVVTVPPVAGACTGIRVKAKDGSVVFARTMEFGSCIKSDIMVVPRGQAWTALAPDGNKGMQWTGKYAYVGPNGFGLNCPIEGMNEKGLYAGAFWMPKGESVFPEVAPADYPKMLAQPDVANWLLGNCATVEEVRDAVLNKVKIGGVLVKTMGMYPYAHWYAMDTTGKAIVIESIHGKVTVTDNPVGVFTNAPSFSWHLRHLRTYGNLSPNNIEPYKLGDFTMRQFGEGSGMVGLPGDSTPPSRFVRAAFFANLALTPADADGAVQVAMDLNDNFTIVKGMVRGKNADGSSEYDYTQWSTVYDMARKAVYFRTYENHNFRMVRFDKLPLTGKKVHIVPMWSVKPAYPDVSNTAK
ncbi:linear amide C-N hydrolase [Pseudodesulfovibrio sp.]|uniref:linear amide C-N hydrolase n=1 Tax=unclassified Pseudodesulfovibrio TaxID=2661612 RepID=UPI003AFF9BBE